MKDSIKANLIIFFIIAIAAFCVSTAFANLTVKEDANSYKLIPIENNSFEPNQVEKVEYHEPKVVNNTTNNTSNTTVNLNNTTTYNVTTYSEPIK